jgi:lysophospholipase L1-like esterase
VTPAPDYPKAASFTGYPEMLAAELHLKLANASCPGETSSSLVSASAVSNGCERTVNGAPGYRAKYPLHVSYKGTQLAYAVSYLNKHKDVRLITLMVGANDLFVCEATTADHCAATAERQALMTKLAKNVNTIISTIYRKTHFHGNFVWVNYYSLNYASPAESALSQSANGAVRGVLRKWRARTADGYGELQKAAAHSGGNTCAAGLLTQLSSGGCGIHPSYAGQSLLAQAVEKAIPIS